MKVKANASPAMIKTVFLFIKVRPPYTTKRFRPVALIYFVF